MNIHHFTTGARGSSRLVRDDQDRFALLCAARRAFGRALLAYCVMDTHLHAVAEAGPASGKRRLTAALATYARAFNRRHGGGPGPLLRGPVEAFACPGPLELARLLRYVHANPVKTAPPLVARPVEFRWSSARAYAGLSLAGAVDVGRAEGILDAPGRRVAGEAPPLAGLERSPFPVVTPREVLLAAADAHGLPERDLSSGRRGGRVAEARSLYMRLGDLEGLTTSQLASALGRSASQARRCAQGDASDEAVRVARTLLRDPGMRARLPRAA